MRLFNILFPALIFLSTAICAQPAQFTLINLNAYSNLSGVPTSPTEIEQFGNSLFALVPEPSSQDAGRLYRSDDNGVNWTKIDLFPGANNDFKIVQLVTTPNSIVFFTLQYTTGVYTKQDMKGYRSTDGGNTFEEVFYVQEIENSNNNNNLVTHIGLDEANGQLFFFYSIQGSYTSKIFISSDEGQNWEPVANDIYPNHVLKITGDNGHLYAQLRDAVVEISDPYHFTMDNLAWADGLGKDIVDCEAFGDSLFFCNENGKVIFSPNGLSGPLSITQLPITLLNGFTHNGYCYFNNDGHFYRSPLGSPAALTDAGYIPMLGTNGNISHPKGRFVSAGNDLYWLCRVPLKSEDGGLSWDVPLTNLPKRGSKVNSFAGQLWLQKDLLFRSNDGVAWELYRDPAGLPPATNYDWYLMKEMQGALYLSQYNYNVDGKVFRSTDGGASWTQIWQGNARPVIQVDLNQQRVFLQVYPYGQGYPSLGLLYSDDLGDTWAPVNGASGFLSLATKGDSIFYYANHVVKYTYDLGQNWQTTAIPYPFQYGGQIMIFPNAQVLLIDNSTKIGYASLDGGQTFAEMFDLQQFGTYITAQNFTQFDSLLVGSGSRATFISKNGGLNWIYFFEGNWEFCDNHSIRNGLLYAGTSGNGQSWEEPSRSTPLQPLLDHLNLISTTGGVANGLTFYDLNGDCNLFFNEPVRPNEVFAFQPGNYLATSGLDGGVRRILPGGNYTLQYSTPQYHAATCFSPPNLTITPGDQSTFTLAFKPTVQIKDLAISMVSTTARPGWPVYFTIKVRNVGTLAVPAGTALDFVYPNNPFSFVDALPLPDNVSAGILSFVLPQINPYSETTIKITLQLPPDPNLAGQVFYLSAGLNTAFSDPTPSNNSTTFFLPVVASYDPNDKTAYTSSPTGELPLSDKELRYLIRFQNTGTDTAFYVVVADTLSAQLDWTTLHTISASHPYRLVMSDPGVASWRFDNILLPDSTTNEAASHGFVYFSIQAKNNVRINDTLRNRAAIYFDFNDPVLTNETATRVVRRAIYRQDETVLPPRAFEAEIIPNPIGERLSCRLKLPEPAVLTITLNDANGRVLTILENKTAFGAGEQWVARLLNDLPAGSYWLCIRSETEQRNLPLVKQ